MVICFLFILLYFFFFEIIIITCTDWSLDWIYRFRFPHQPRTPSMCWSISLRPLRTHIRWPCRWCSSAVTDCPCVSHPTAETWPDCNLRPLTQWPHSIFDIFSCRAYCLGLPADNSNPALVYKNQCWTPNGTRTVWANRLCSAHSRAVSPFVALCSATATMSIWILSARNNSVNRSNAPCTDGSPAIVIYWKYVSSIGGACTIPLGRDNRIWNNCRCFVSIDRAANRNFPPSIPCNRWAHHLDRV